MHHIQNIPKWFIILDHLPIGNGTLMSNFVCFQYSKMSAIHLYVWEFRVRKWLASQAGHTKVHTSSTRLLLWIKAKKQVQNGTNNLPPPAPTNTIINMIISIMTTRSAQHFFMQPLPISLLHPSWWIITSHHKKRLPSSLKNNNLPHNAPSNPRHPKMGTRNVCRTSIQPSCSAIPPVSRQTIR